MRSSNPLRDSNPVFQTSITAIPVLLDMLAIESCVVTMDAIGRQQDIAQKTLDRKADYILMVKGNQKSLKQQVEKVFTLEKPSHSHRQTDMGHGGVEKRGCDVISELRFLDVRSHWPGLERIVRVRSERAEKKTGKITQETRCYISSLRGPHSSMPRSGNTGLSKTTCTGRWVCSSMKMPC